MDKKQLSERDICTKFITPALEQAGWDIHTQVMEKFALTKGRVIVRGQLHTRAKHKRVDSRSKPLTIEEFDLDKKCWGGRERKGRKVTGYAWKISAKKIEERNYNLDCKNPHEVEVNHRDPEELMQDYQDIAHQLEEAQKALRLELMAALGGNA